MGHMKKQFHLGVLIVLCQSPCLYQIAYSEFNKNNNGSADFKILSPPLLTSVQYTELLSTPIKRNKNRHDDDLLICEGLVAMDSNSYNSNNKDIIIVIPLNLLNITSLSILFVLILFGSYYVWKVLTREKCLCKICKGEYKVMGKLSEGGFGEIYKIKQKGKFFILKKCRTENITEADDIMIEAKYLRDLEHKHIVKYIDDFIHLEFIKGKIDPNYYVYLIMEYCEEGDLKAQIDDVYNHHKHFTKIQIIDMLIQITEGLNYLHNRNIIHRDIKSQNIFLTKDGILRIGDFGLAKKVKKNNRNTIMTKVGTDCYMAPEVLQGHNYGRPADVWSLGCIILELCTLNFMWLYDNSIGVNALIKPDFLDAYVADIKHKEHILFRDILKHMFVLDPDKRMKTDTLLKKLKKEKRLLHKNSSKYSNK